MRQLGLVTRLIESNWFAPMAAERLGLLRIAIGCYALWYVWTRRELITELSDKGDRLYEPVGVFRLFGTPIDSVAVEWMLYSTLIAGCLFVFGLWYRVSGPAFAILLLCTLCYRNSWSMIYHMHNVLVVHVLILGFARSADSLSVPALFRRSNRGADADGDWEYGWPVRLMIAAIAMAYFLSGAAKLLGPEGIEWASGESLRSQIAVDTIRKEVLEGGGMPAAFLLYDYVWVFTLMGVMTLVLEFGAPLFMTHRYSMRIWALSAWAMHWGIFLIMGIKFRYQLCFVMFLPFFPIERPLVWLSGRAGIRANSSR